MVYVPVASHRTIQHALQHIGALIQCFAPSGRQGPLLRRRGSGLKAGIIKKGMEQRLEGQDWRSHESPMHHRSLMTEWEREVRKCDDYNWRVLGPDEKTAVSLACTTGILCRLVLTQK